MPAVWERMGTTSTWKIVEGHTYIHMSRCQNQMFNPGAKIQCALLLFGGDPIVLLRSSLTERKMKQICLPSKILEIGYCLLFCKTRSCLFSLLVWYSGKECQWDQQGSVASIPRPSPFSTNSYLMVIAKVIVFFFERLYDQESGISIGIQSFCGWPCRRSSRSQIRSWLPGMSWRGRVQSLSHYLNSMPLPRKTCTLGSSTVSTPTIL